MNINEKFAVHKSLGEPSFAHVHRVRSGQHVAFVKEPVITVQHNKFVDPAILFIVVQYRHHMNPTHQTSFDKHIMYSEAGEVICSHG